MNSIRFEKSRAVCVLAAVWPLAVHAGDVSGEVSIHGFGTVGAVYHEAQGVQFMRDASQPHGASAGKLSFEPDSVLGVQLDVQAAREVQLTLQAVSRLNTDSNYDPQISWAYLKYQPADELAIRAGRLHFDAFMRGDTNMIDYGNLLVRSPLSFYPPSFNGADMEFVTPWAKGQFHLKGFAGAAYGKRVAPGYSYDLTGSRTVGLTVQYDKGAWSNRLSVGRITMKRGYAPLTAGGSLAGVFNLLPNGAQIMSLLETAHRPYNFAIAALTYDAGPLQAMASYGHFASPHWPDRNAFMAYAGYRFGNWTPYAGFFLDRTGRAIIPTGIPDGMSPQTDTVNQVSAMVQNALKRNQSDVAIGLRHDFARNMALKFQIDGFRYRDPDTIHDPELLSIAPGTPPRRYKRMTLYSVALNFVF